MNKSDFIEVVKKVGGYDTKKGAEQAISAFTDAVKQVLVKKDSVELVGFGKFETAVQAAKTGKVPGTNKKYTTKEKMVPKFKAGKALKDEVAKMKVVKK
ncbi:HU family DNA-binding protein [Helicobacter sp. 23-1045]